MVPEFIRGTRMIRYQLFRLKLCKNLPLLYPGMVNGNPRLYSSVLDIIQSSSTIGKTHIVPHSVQETPKINPPRLEKLIIKALLKNKDVSTVAKEFNSVENVNSVGLLIFGDIAELKNVAPERRMEIAEKLLEALRLLKVTITEDHYIALLTCCLKSKLFPNLDSLLASMKNDGVQISSVLQHTITKCLTKLGKPEERQKFVKNLEKANVKVSNSVLAEQIFDYAASGDINKALEEYDKHRMKDPTADKNLLITLLRGLIAHGDENTLKEQIYGSSFSTQQFYIEDIYPLFDTILDFRQFHLVPTVVLSLGEGIYKTFLIDVIIKLIHNSDIEKGFDLLRSLYNLREPVTGSVVEFPPSLYENFIHRMEDLGHPFSDVLEKCKELRKLEQCHFILEKLLFRHLVLEEISQSLQVIYALSECGASLEQNYFWPLLIQAHKRFGREGIFHVMEIMSWVGVYPESETLLKYVFPYLNPYNSFKNFKIMSLSGRMFQYLTEVFTLYALENNCIKECAYLLKKRPLSQSIKYYFLEKPLNEAFLKHPHILDLVTIARITNAVDLCDVLMNLWRAGNEDRMRSLLSCLKQNKLYGKNDQIADALISKPNLPSDLRHSIQKWMEMKAKMTVEKPSSMEVEQESVYECIEILKKSEIHIDELEYKNMNVCGELFRIIKYAMKVGLYEKALDARDRLLKIGGPELELSPTFLACLSRLFEYEKDYEKALRFYRTVRLKYPDFLLDVPKVAGVGSVFLQIGAIDDLLDLLERMPVWWGNLNLIEHKMVKILKAAADTGDQKLVQTVFDIMLKKRVIRVTKNTLAPFLDTYIIMEKNEEAVKELERLISVYKIVPTVMFLIWHFTMSREFDKLDRVISIVLETTGGNEDVIISTLRTIACLGDVDVLDLYFKKYDVRETDGRFSHVLPWQHFGGELEIRMKALETFILKTNNKEAKFNFAAIAVEHVCLERNQAAAVRLLEFLGKIGMLTKFEQDLNKIIELTKTFGEPTVPRKYRKSNSTIWKSTLN